MNNFNRQNLPQKIAYDRKWFVRLITKLLNDKIACNTFCFCLVDYKKKFGVDDKDGYFIALEFTWPSVVSDYIDELWSERLTKEEDEQYEYSPVGYCLFFLLGKYKIYGFFYKLVVSWFCKSCQKDIYPFFYKSHLKDSVDNFSKNYDRYVPRIISEKIYNEYMKKISDNIDEIISR